MTKNTKPNLVLRIFDIKKIIHQSKVVLFTPLAYYFTLILPKTIS